MYETLSNYALSKIKGGEPITLTAIMAVLVIAIITVVVYKLFTSKSGPTLIPGGFKFEWK